MSDVGTLPPQDERPSVVVDLDAARRVRPPVPSRLARLEARQVEDAGRSVRVQALERLGRRHGH